MNDIKKKFFLIITQFQENQSIALLAVKIENLKITQGICHLMLQY